MSKTKKKISLGTIVLLIVLGLVDLACIIYLLMRGNNIAILNPKGLIAQEQFNLIIFIVAILFLVAIPTILLLYFIAFKYRESNKKARYDPDAKHSKLLDVYMWGIPTVFMLILAFVLIPATRHLEPKKQIDSNVKTMNIQVIAMRWKWLFLYPEQKIATVNFVQMPVDQPVQFDLTADEAPMSAFWIPNLGGMLYAMTGHKNPLNLMADTAGDYPGSTAEINGAGFAGMKFTARASSQEEFDSWAMDIRQSSEELDDTAYNNLLKPSENHPQAYFSSYENGLYDKVLMKYMGSSDGQTHITEYAH